MKIHEFQAAAIFQKGGIPVADGRVAENVDGALRIAREIGYPVVLKSQVLVGGRGKAGGIKKVQDANALKTAYGGFKSLKIKGYGIEKVLVARAIDIKKEFYLGATIDNRQGDVVLIASSQGGVEIEEVAKNNPQAIYKYYMRGEKKIDKVRGREFIDAVFDEPTIRKQGMGVFEKLVKIFFEYDCTLAEINPLVIDGNGKMVAADAKINFDDNALYRHEEFQTWRDMAYEDPQEMKAKENGLSFVKLDGNVGCIVNGAGLAMGTMDVIKLSGGKPANFLDVGGSSSPQKVLSALELILKDKNIKVILINIFGGITRCDDIANGILQAKERIEIPVPLVVRLTGTNEREAKALLSQNGITTFSTMREAVDRAVALTLKKVRNKK